MSMRLLLVLFILGGTFSCKKTANSNNLLPPISGKAGEVVLVMSDNLFDGSLGDSIKSVLQKEEIALPQSGMQGAEPIFDLVQIPPVAFSNVFRSHRNIINLKLNPDLDKAVIKVDHNYWAFQQLYIRMEAPNKEAMAELIYNKDDFIASTIRTAEIDRAIYLNRKYENTELHRSLLANHDVITYFPKGYTALVDSSNFVWIQHDPRDMIQGVLIWDYPYEDENQTEYAPLLSIHDEILRKNVPGRAEGSYMAIEFEQAPVHSKTFNYNDHFVREIKGLWKMENGFMGGPFVSWTFVDESRNRLVTAFGFVYAPKYEKRNHIRKVESLLRTIDFED